MKRLLAFACASLLALLTLVADAAQNTIVLPVAGPMPMSTFVTTYLNPALRSLLTCNTGTSAPTNGTGAAAEAGQCWWDTTTATAYILKFYDGAQWVASDMRLNTSTHTLVVVQTIATLTYSASISTDASLGNTFVITVTNGTAFTINAPTNPATGQRVTYTIRNTSGGAVGVITWNAVFKMATWTSPATANSRSIEFTYDGTNWVERVRGAADIPN
jgi:hypothetical protein